MVAVAAAGFAVMTWKTYDEMKAKEGRVDQLTLKYEEAVEKAKEASAKGDSLSTQQYIDEARKYGDERKVLIKEIDEFVK